MALNLSSLELDLSISSSPVFKPNMIWPDGMSLIFQNTPESVKVFARQLRDSHGWKFYSVDQSRGRCYYRGKVITIPKFAIISKQVGFLTWYISHEMSHAFDAARSNHGDSFMRELIRICPHAVIHHELGYKPRNAARNGITNPFPH